MRKTKTSRVIAVLLAFLICVSVLPAGAIADWEDDNVIFDGTSFGTNGYYNVISKKDYTLVPGAAVESEMVLNNASGSRRQVMHIMEVDPSNPDISIVPGYYGIDKDLSDVNNWKPAGVTETVQYYEDTLGYNVVGAMNTSLAYDCDAPIDFLVYNGVNLSQGKHHAKTFLAVIKDPDTGAISCELHSYTDGIPENCWQAVSANFDFTVKDGELVSKTEERTSSSAARSMLGVKEDGTLVIVMNDGRGANNSVGFCNYELGESMLALGCKWAVNCDGGGSSSFVTKRAGETVNTMRCVPCDGAERPTINSILITSNVGPTGELNNVDVAGAYDYFAPGTSYAFTANAIDTHGYAMDMPADAAWALSDDSFGTIADGVFSSNGTLGDVDVQIVSGGAVVGSKTIHVANPTTLSLTATSTTLPYSTADKPRSVTLPIVAKIGEADVYFDATVFNVASSVAEAGTMDGLTFTATTDETVEGTVLTLTYLPTGQELVYTISFGKGSEILWDFEDQDLSNWYGGSEDVKVWLTEHGVPEADQLKTLISGGQISFSEQSHTFLSTRENGGQVHNGDSALGVSFDFRNVEFNSWVYALLYNVQDQYVLRDVANGKKATALGMWCYVPEGFCNPAGDTSGALAMQLTVYKNPQGTSGTQLNFQFYSEHQKKRVSLNQCTEADIPENRWVYLTADLTGSDYYSLTNPYGTTYREPSFFRMYIKPTRAQVLTYYFDDFTLDYSSAVDDRDAPVITAPTYCVNDTNIELDGQTIDTNVVSFDATIADYAASNAEGLNYATAAIYADGVKLNGVTASGSSMGVKNVRLSDGTHAIKFEIYDNAGNFSSVTKYITVDADPTKAVVTISGHNDLNNVPECDSVYYVDLVASDINQISNVTAELKLNTANHWELDHMIAAKGFEAAYSYNEISKLATVTVTKTGETDLTGEQILVSIPARVWIFDENTNVGGDGSSVQHMTVAERFNSSYGEPKVFVDVNVVSGAIDYVDNTTGTFGGSISVATKLTGNKSNGMWHQHDAELTTLELAPSCTTAGYTGRTYCETCGSVVDWGTDIPAAGHDYELSQLKRNFIISDNGASQSPDLEFNGGIGYYYDNGYHSFETDASTNVVTFTNSGNFETPTLYYWVEGQEAPVEWPGTAMTYLGQNEYGQSQYTFEMPEATEVLRCADCGELFNGVYTDGKTYVDGVVAEGWVGDSYYVDGVKLTGVQFVEGYYYDFGEDGVTTGKYTGLFMENGKYHYAINGSIVTGWQLIDDDWYFFHPNTQAPVSTYNNGTVTYAFEANGKLISGVWYNDGVGTKYYYGPGYYRCVAGNSYANANWVEIGGNTYCFDRQGYRHEGIRVVISSNDPAQLCEFTGDGVYVGIYEAEEDGLFQCNGYKCFLENGVPIQTGLILVDGYYYYINTSCHTVTGTYNCTNMNGLLPPGEYEFDADGKMILNEQPEEPEEPDPDLQNGPDGEYFYVNGDKLPEYYGLAEYQGDYYYISAGGKYVKNVTDRLVNKTNDLTFPDGTPIPNGRYDFDADGKMIIKNGPEGDYFYVNGTRVPEYTGLVTYEGDFYYVVAGGKMVKDVTDRLVNKTNDLTFADGTPIPNGKYDFDEDGKMLIKNGPEGEYFYVNGIKVPEYTGLVTYDGKFYYVSAGGKMVRNVVDRYINKTNGLTFADGTPIQNGKYSFDETGAMVILNGPVDDYFYVNGVKVPAYTGLVEYDGNFYYVSTGGTIVKDIVGRYINKTNGLTTADGKPIGNGKYTFDADGKMVVPELPREGFVNEFGGKYYYKDNELQLDAGLLVIDDHYYYVDNNGRVLTNERGTANKTFDYLKPGKYNFDENSVMIVDPYFVIGVKNARDIAILNSTSNDVKIKEGMIIRGSELDGAYRDDLPEGYTDYAVAKLMNFGIKYELDLRPQNELTTDVFGPTVTHDYFDMVYYDEIFTDDGKAVVKDVFTELANPNNYPMYVHCTFGLERTGTVCYLLEAVLGMSEWNLSHDYCFTNGSHEVNVLTVRDGLAEYPGNTIQARAEAYLLSCGVTQEQIDSIKEILLED